jgi:hypothetical protein
MRARSTSSRAAISASCNDWTRATSSCSIARRRASRTVSSACSRETSVVSTSLRALISACLTWRSASMRSERLAASAITRSSSAISTAFF